MDASPDTIRHWLAAMAHSDDSRAFRAFFDYFYPDAYRMAFSHLREQETAEELTSDVFLRLWDRRRTLTEIEHIRPYLLAAIRNHCLNHHRRKAPALLPLDDAPDMAAPDAANPEQATIWNDMHHRLAQTIETLPPRCRMVFRMVREQQLSYRDVADALGIAPKTVEIQMGIALKRLSHLAHTLDEHALLSGVFIFSCFF